MKWVLLVGALGLLGAFGADLVLRRRVAQHTELVVGRERARRAADLAPMVRTPNGYRAAVLTRPRAVPPPPRGPLLEGRIRAAVGVGCVVLAVAWSASALKPHHASLHLRATLAGLTRTADDQGARLLQAQARLQLSSSSGLVDPVVGRYGPDVLIAGGRVEHGNGVQAAIEQLGRTVRVAALAPRPDGLSCGTLESPEGGTGVGCLDSARGVVVGVLDLAAGVTVDDVAALTKRAITEGIS